MKQIIHRRKTIALDSDSLRRKVELCAEKAKEALETNDQKSYARRNEMLRRADQFKAKMYRWNELKMRLVWTIS